MTGDRVAIISSCDISDTCDDLSLPAVRSGALRPVWHGCPPVAGLVTTWRAGAGDSNAPVVADQLEALARTKAPVLLIDLGGRTDLQCWGAVLATAALHYGVGGVLVNGSVRDVDELAELCYPTFALGTFPACGGGRLRLLGIDVEVTLEGAGIVRPGDMVAADASGAVFFPGWAADRVLVYARARAMDEQRKLARIRSGADPREVFTAAGTAPAGAAERAAGERTPPG